MAPNREGNNPKGKPFTSEPGEEVSERDLLIFQAEICEQSCRFDDMVDVMNRLCHTYCDLSVEERNLLSCAYKNVIGSRRTSWRIISENLLEQPQSHGGDNTLQAVTNDNKFEQEQHQERKGNTNATKDFKYKMTVVENSLKAIESELRLHCGNIIDILTDRLIPAVAGTGESRVFYYKMKGDYMRYLCEISVAEERKEKANESLLAYKSACDKAMIELPPTHPVRLGLMLNFSVFYYDILKSPERSCRLAKQAFDDAIAELDTLSEESYRDSTIIMQLLRDNLNLWESEQSIQGE